MSSNNPPQARTVIVAALDRKPASDAALNTASAFGRMIGAELHFVHVVPAAQPPSGPVAPLLFASLQEGRSFIDGVARRVAEHFAGRVSGHVVAGDPCREILQLASDLQADLIIVGSHEKTALERLITSSVSQSVLKKAHCAVLVARLKDYPASDIPEIEPPCPKCLDAQRSSEGETLWCTQHSERHVHGHVFYASPTSFGAGSTFLRPG